MNNTLLPISEELLSKLIGLIRSFQNNEDLLSNSSYLLVLKVLVTNDINLLEELDKEKRKIVPNCTIHLLHHMDHLQISLHR